jgi:hypothetical protein
MKLLIMQFPQLPIISSLFGPNILLSAQYTSALAKAEIPHLLILNFTERMKFPLSCISSVMLVTTCYRLMFVYIVNELHKQLKQ